MNSKKLTIVLAALLVAVLGLGGYLVYTQKQNNETLSSQNTVQTQSGENTPANNEAPANNSDANTSTNSSSNPTNQTLKTYTNTKYGFEFQYPKEWEVYTEDYSSEFDKHGIIVAVGPSENIKFKIKPPEGTEKAPSYFSVGAYVPNKVLEVSKDCKNSELSTKTVTSFTISGVKTNKCTAPSMFGTYMNINFSSHSNYYLVSSDLYEGTNKAVVDKILTTFKLTK